MLRNVIILRGGGNTQLQSRRRRDLGSKPKRISSVDRRRKRGNADKVGESRLCGVASGGKKKSN